MGGVLTGHSYNVFPDFPSIHTCKLLFRTFAAWFAPGPRGTIQYSICKRNNNDDCVRKNIQKKNTFKVHAVFLGTRLHFSVLVWLSRLLPYLLKTIENFRRSNTTKQLRHVYTCISRYTRPRKTRFDTTRAASWFKCFLLLPETHIARTHNINIK